jgi:hypothetical protein
MRSSQTVPIQMANRRMIALFLAAVEPSLRFPVSITLRLDHDGQDRHRYEPRPYEFTGASGPGSLKASRKPASGAAPADCGLGSDLFTRPSGTLWNVHVHLGQIRPCTLEPAI